MILFPVLLFMLAPSIVFAQDHSHNTESTIVDSKYLALTYSQPHYLLDDPQGDRFLLYLIEEVPVFLYYKAIGEDQNYKGVKWMYHAKELALHPEFKAKEDPKNVILTDYLGVKPNDYPIHIEGVLPPFHPTKLTLMMKNVMTEEAKANGFIPKVGTFHRWSQIGRSKNLKSFPEFAWSSKILLALSRGVTGRYMVTDKEDQLTDWILSQPRDSINLEMMFRSSYRLNQGDVYLSLLTIENVLSRYWQLPHRDKRAVTSRLKNITNCNYYTDKYGAWYHLFGMMLYGYVKGETKAIMVGAIEDLGSNILSKFKGEPQEEFINENAGSIGANLNRFVVQNEYKQFISLKPYNDENFYMTLNENFSERIKQKILIQKQKAQ